MDKLKELGISLIRTSLVPPVAGYLVAFFVAHNITAINASWVYTGVTILFTGLWYLVFRAIEILAKNPKIKKIAGIFLGFPRVDVPKP